ncbi:hypothetical protein [Erwinia sp. CGal63]|uniref:hypothetical protein n=1 Tax=Erwinia sp. CGal63 TaxID=2919889 RepID=UPI00300B5C37
MKAEQASCDEWFKASMYRELAYRISLWTFFTCFTFYLASTKTNFSFTKNLKDTIEKSGLSINTIGLWVLVFMAIAWFTKDIERMQLPEWKNTAIGKSLSFYRKVIGDILLWLCSTCNAMLFITIGSFIHALKNHPLPGLHSASNAAGIVLLFILLEAAMVVFYVIIKKEGGLLSGHIKKKINIIILHISFISLTILMVSN